MMLRLHSCARTVLQASKWSSSWTSTSTSSLRACRHRHHRQLTQNAQKLSLLPSSSFSTTSSPSSSSSSFRSFDPNSILPSGHGEVRILNNTARDAQQSNLSAEMSDDHRQVIGTMVNDCYKDINGPPGYEQIWGGTVPMFDVWKRGVHPFEELRRMAQHMPNTPGSALIRSNGLNALANQPMDVVDQFIKLAHNAGVNVFTNFDAHNDWRNHVAVSEAVHKYGGHFQAALSWAVWPQDPTVYNVMWAVDFFKEMKALGAHSFYVKDPSGVLTPEMAGLLAAKIKDAYPDMPLVFHSHYQTGYAYMTYLEAVRNGANGVECSLGFHDGAGQPYGLSMLRAFEDYGFDTGNPNKSAMDKIARYCREIQPLYAQGRVVRLPNIDVEQTGIAGGQRSILDKELMDAGQPHLIPQVDTEVQAVRREGGLVCQVTPAADSYAREAMRRLRGGDPHSGFTPGYAAILTGECGITKEPVVAEQRRRALAEKAARRVHELHKAGHITDSSVNAILSEGGIDNLVHAVEVLSAPITLAQRVAELQTRIEQLQRAQQDTDVAASLTRKIERAVGIKGVSSIQDRIDLLTTELNETQTALDSANKAVPHGVTEESYTNVLRGTPSQEDSDFVLSQSACSTLSNLVESKELSLDAARQIIAAAGVVTCVHSDLLPPGLAEAEAFVHQLEESHIIGLAESREQFEENVMVQAMFGKAAIPGLTVNFFKNYRTNTDFWPALYEKPADSTAAATTAAVKSGPLLRGVHLTVERLIGDDLDAMIDMQKSISELEARLEAGGRRMHADTRGKVTAKRDLIQSNLAEHIAKAEQVVAQTVERQPGLLSGKYPAVSTDGRTSKLVTLPIEQEVSVGKQLIQELLHLRANE
jgi:oxaloacetate decarboxylase (Na+ extruding) subunit alpha